MERAATRELAALADALVRLDAAIAHDTVEDRLRWEGLTPEVAERDYRRACEVGALARGVASHIREHIRGRVG